MALARAIVNDKGLGMSEPLIEVLNEEQCLQLLGQMPVGRVGITVGSLPVILPVNHAVVDGYVIFRTIPGTKLRATTLKSVVAFEVDSYESDGGSGWSVLVQGMASQVTDPADVKYFRAALGTPWGITAMADDLVQIKVERLSGRRFGVDLA